MAEHAGTGTDNADAWKERLGWAFGLIADDPADRAVAAARLAEARATVTDALSRYNEMWRVTLPLGREEQMREPGLLRARRVYLQAQRHSLPEALWSHPAPRNLGTWSGLPYALLFLEWEARFPQEWTTHAKAWGTKQRLIRALAQTSPGPVVRAKLTDLVELVVSRAYRCKDREYVRVARAVDGPELRARLDRVAEADSPWARTHAGYVRWLLERPELPNTSRTWRGWLAREG
ncbi:hypothetical protein ACFYNO_40595 [Kitasatospora sp. NPDC006697]|uniref:hypothetical protein n=1 Tax=Kitasatospora sp. NPDC006697 TaxID=3364020 RepID=UPI0036CC1326